MASLTRTIRRHLKWSKPKSKSNVEDKDVYRKQKLDRADIVKEDKDA